MARIAVDPILEIKSPPVHLSYSQVTKLVPRLYKYGCQRQWGYDKLTPLPFVGSLALVAGSSFDEGVNGLLSGRMQGWTETESRLQAWRMVEEKWQERQSDLKTPSDEEQSKRYLDAIRLGLQAFVKEYPEMRPAAVQRRHDYHVHVGPEPTDFRTVTGYSDRIEPDGTVVDMKWSGSKRWNDKGEWDEGWTREKRDQLAMYWMAREIEQARGDRRPVAPVIPRGRLEVVYMRAGNKEAQMRSILFDFTEEDRNRVVTAIREADTAIREGRLPARPGDACAFCSYRARCQSDEMRRGRPFLEVVGAVNRNGGKS